MISTALQTATIIQKLRCQGFMIDFPAPEPTKFSKTLAKFHAMRASGRCVKCGKPTGINPKTNTPKVHCEYHAEKNRLNSIARRAREKEAFQQATGK